MIRRLTVLSFVAASACAMPIPDFRPAPRPAPAPVAAPIVIPQSATERFIGAAQAAGCEVNSLNSEQIMADAILSREDLGRIMTELRAGGRGQIVPGGNAFRVTTGICA